MEFRTLRADEIDCRVNTINEKGLTLLLYKDARVDMNILDETVGSENWQRDHKELKGNIYCGISIWSEDKQQWVTKWDCGSESYTEKEKGEASDSFKRAGFNVGIGRELYTSPFIWISKDNCTIQLKNDKYTTYDTFRVKSISYNANREIDGLTIVNSKTNIVAFRYGKQDDMITEEQKEQIKKKFTKEEILELLNDYDHKKISEFTKEEAEMLLSNEEK